MLLPAVDIHTYSFLGGLWCSGSVSLGYNFEFFHWSYFLWHKKRWCLSTVLHRERRGSNGASLPAPSARSLCGVSAEHVVTNGNYICVFFMNPSNIGLLKMLPRYFSLSDAGDQIGMLLRQSRSTHPQFACDVFDRVSRGIPCIIQLQMYTLNSCWCVGSRAVRSPIWAALPPSPSKHGVLMQLVSLYTTGVGIQHDFCLAALVGTPSMPETLFIFHVDYPCLGLLVTLLLNAVYAILNDTRRRFLLLSFCYACTR